MEVFVAVFLFAEEVLVPAFFLLCCDLFWRDVCFAVFFKNRRVLFLGS